ncbi:MAG: phosphotransferase KptA/Tpt1 [Piptocephalis tieghemiana]|nr:MAG: phosphotransferase KptA/Tpt1 [Piptocephalis tieghemiana]
MPPRGPPKERLSRSLSYVLRHGATKESLVILPDGYVFLEALLKRPKFKQVTLEDVQEVVNENGKQRFSMVYQRVGDQEGWWIRANQGHSLPVPELELRTISSVEEAPSMVIHGTDLSFWPSIRRDGLKAMGRNHIHMASGMPGHEGVISGMRSRCSLFIHLDISRVLQDGIPLYESANGVILSPGQGDSKAIPATYFSSVVDQNGQVYWKDGKAVLEP